MEKEVNKKEIEEQIKKLNEQLEERKEYLNNETNEGYGNWAIDEKISELTAKIDELTELLKKVEEKENIGKMLEEKEKQLEEEGIPYGEWQLDEEWMKLKQEYDKIEIQEPNAKKKDKKEQVGESSRKEANNKAKSEQDKTEKTTKKINDDKKEKTEPEEGKSQEDNSDPTIIRVTDGEILDNDSDNGKTNTAVKRKFIGIKGIVNKLKENIEKRIGTNSDKKSMFEKIENSSEQDEKDNATKEEKTESKAGKSLFGKIKKFIKDRWKQLSLLGVATLGVLAGATAVSDGQNKDDNNKAHTSSASEQLEQNDVSQWADGLEVFEQAKLDLNSLKKLDLTDNEGKKISDGILEEAQKRSVTVMKKEKDDTVVVELLIDNYELDENGNLKANKDKLPKSIYGYTTIEKIDEVIKEIEEENNSMSAKNGFRDGLKVEFVQRQNSINYPNEDNLVEVNKDLEKQDDGRDL